MFKEGFHYKHKNFRDVTVKVINVTDEEDIYKLSIVWYNLLSHFYIDSDLIEVKKKDINNWGVAKDVERI